MEGWGVNRASFDHGKEAPRGRQRYALRRELQPLDRSRIGSQHEEVRLAGYTDEDS